MRKTNNLQRDQSGFASIVIALILIIVLALLTVGFAQLSRREQQSALDRQLASQAYYAAESGINDTSQAIVNAINNPGAVPSLQSLSGVDPKKCLGPQIDLAAAGTTFAAELPGSSIGPLANSVSYSCVLLNLHPPVLAKTPLSANTAWTTSFSTTGTPAAGLDSLQINWHSNHGKGASSNATPVFNPASGAGSWTAAAVLQVSITPLQSLNRQSLINNTFTTYLYPKCSGSSTAHYNNQTVNNQVPIVNGSGDPNCATNNSFTATIDNLNGSLGEAYAVNILDYYDDSGVFIINAKTAAGTALDWSNSEATVDVTGQAQNVLKRIQVYVPLNQPGSTPSQAVQGQNICKQFDTAPVVTSGGGTQFSSFDSSCTLSP